MLLILNPCAGMRKAAKALADIVAVFNRADYDVQVYVTSGAMDAISAVAKSAPGKDLVVCCGGDGTFNEVCTGLLNAKLDLPVGYIPAGSTNDFANSLQLSTDPVEAAHQIVNGKPSVYDIGKFGNRYFSYVASFGAFTRASYNTPQNIKNAIGHTAYVLGGIPELFQITNSHVRIVLDGETLENDYLFGAICNSTSVGGLISLDPSQVDMSDGKFEVFLIRAPKDLAELTEFISAVQKQQYNCRMMTFRTATNITVYAEPGMDWTLDGEKEAGHAQIEVVNLHHAIRLVK